MSLIGEHAFDSFFVVESLGARDRIKTGQELHAGFLSPFGRQRGAYVSQPLLAHSRSDLVFAMKRVLNEVQERQLLPCLQLEMHGNERGFELASGEFLDWSDLVRLLRPINRATKNSLFVGASMCRGAWMFQALTQSISEPCPMWGFVGSARDHEPSALLQGFGEFYRRLTHERDLDAATEGLAASLGTAYRVLCEQVLGRFWQQVLRDWPANARYTAVAVRAVRKMLRLSPIQLPQELANRLTYEEHRRRYLWVDEFPSESPRFPLNLEHLRELDLGFEPPA